MQKMVDLASTTSIRNFVAEFTKQKRHLSVLINNAAIGLNPKDLTRRTTKERFEVTMATNYLGHFLLTSLLLEYMIETASFLGDGRIISITCGGHNHKIQKSTKNLSNSDLDNFQPQKKGTCNGLQAYENSKLCSVLMTYTLAEKFKSTKVTVNTADPGKTGKFFVNGMEDMSSPELYDVDTQQAVWKLSSHLMNIPSMIIDDNGMNDISPS